MKKVINLITVITIFSTIYSCTKSTNSSNSTSTKPPQPKLQCFVNGALVNYDAVWDSTIGWTHIPAFQLDSENVYNQPPIVRNILQSDVDLNNFICLGLTNPLTTTGSFSGYSNGLSQNALFDARLNGIWSNGQGTDTINVTTLSNGKASGNFVGTIQMTNSTTLHITNGTFSNLPIYY